MMPLFFSSYYVSIYDDICPRHGDFCHKKLEFLQYVMWYFIFSHQMILFSFSFLSIVRKELGSVASSEPWCSSWMVASMVADRKHGNSRAQSFFKKIAMFGTGRSHAPGLKDEAFSPGMGSHLGNQDYSWLTGTNQCFILVVITHHCDQSYCLVHPPLPPHPPIPTRENGCTYVLTALKSEIKPSTPASFHNFRTPKVVIRLNTNHFHEFW